MNFICIEKMCSKFGDITFEGSDFLNFVREQVNKKDKFELYDLIQYVKEKNVRNYEHINIKMDMGGYRNLISLLDSVNARDVSDELKMCRGLIECREDSKYRVSILPADEEMFFTLFRTYINVVEDCEYKKIRPMYAKRIVIDKANEYSFKAGFFHLFEDVRLYCLDRYENFYRSADDW